MRILSWFLILLVILAGLLFGALNPEPVRVDLYYAAFDMALGPVLLLAALAGALLGGLAVGLGVVLPLKRRLRRQRHAAARDAASPAAELPPPADAA